ncbi:serine hydrolase domain-containing protein [Amycolatopsis sp. NPDC026612]|uniref:serine hydrolase domain-containing protein n=1 Tax=Amycolatopsis sp. NPDC026612 TaxID=3155466 RepID=UPI0033F96BFC
MRHPGIRFTALAVASIAGLSLTTVGTAAAIGGPDRQAIIRALDLMTTTGAAGAQVRIAADGREFTARSGVARLGSPAGVPVNGRFRIASVTKTFTATVLLQLAGEGRLALDDTVSRYLPGLLPDGDRITVRMLLQHSSGLYNYSDDLTGDPVELQRHWDPQDLVAMATAHPLNFPPGTASKYSNTDYIVAGLLVEHLTGRSWATAVRSRIIHPLGLHDTSLPGDRTTIPGPHAHGYTPRDGTLVDVTAMNPSVGWAAGEIISTTADLDTFTEALFGGRLLRPEQLAEMTAPAPGAAYGLGLSTNVLSCGVQVWGHTGDVPGYHTLLAVTRDGRTRLQLSLTTATRQTPLQGYRQLVDEVFCG